MLSPLKRRWYLWLGTFLFVAGHLLRPIPTDPDAHFTLVELLGTFFLFSWWALATCCFGYFVTCKLSIPGSPPALWLAFGSFFDCGLVTVAGFAGFIHYRDVPFYSAVLFAGLLLPEFCSKTKPVPSFFPDRARTSGSWERWASVLLFLALGYSIAYRLMCGALVHGYSDPLLYHLYAPRVWVDRGTIFYPTSWGYAFQASSWEYLYIWGHIITGESGGGGLIEGQFFGQWTHVFFGYAASLLGLFELLKDRFKSRILHLMAVLIAGSSLSLLTMSYLAKNDWGVISWTLAGGILILTGQGRWGLDVLAGAFFGLALSTKPTSLFGVIAVIGIALSARKFSDRQGLNIRRISLWTLGILISSLPILVRDFVATGDPFFPYMVGIFKSWDVAPQFLRYLNGLTPHLDRRPSDWFRTWGRIFLDSKFSVLVLLLPVALLYRDKRRIVSFGGAVLVACGWFPIFAFSESFLRWVGIGLVLMPALGVYCADHLLGRIQSRTGESARIAFSSGAVLVVVLLTNPGSLFKVGGTLLSDTPDQVIRTSVHIGGAAKAWLRLNVKEGEKVASTGDDELYYVSYLNVPSLIESPKYAAALGSIRNEHDLVTFLKQSGFTYLLDSRHFDTPSWGWFAMAIHTELSKHPDTSNSIVFRSPDAIVISVQKFTDALGAGSTEQLIPPLNLP